MKVYSTRGHPQRRAHRPRRDGQDEPGVGAPVRGGRSQPTRASGRRDGRHRLRRRGDRAQDLAADRARAPRVEGPEGQPHRHPRVRRVRVRRQARRGGRRHDAAPGRGRGRRAGHHRARVGYAEQFGLPVVRGQQARPGERLVRARGRGRSASGSGARPCRSSSRSAPSTRSPGSSTCSAREAYRFATDRSGKMTEEAVPAAMAEDVRAARAALVEIVAETDDALMERFFEAGELGAEELLGGLRARDRRSGKPVPGRLRVGRARRGSPTAARRDRRAVARSGMARGGRHRPAHIDRGAPARGRGPAGLGVRVQDDRRPVRRTSVPVPRHLGNDRRDSHVINRGARDHAERLANLARPAGQAARRRSPSSAPATWASSPSSKRPRRRTRSADPAHPVRVPARSRSRDPAISFAVEPKSKGDEEKISTALARLIEEDPVLRVRRDARTHELLVSGHGQVHVEVAMRRMKTKFGVEADAAASPRSRTSRRSSARSPRIEGKHKKQTGGRGQFGDVRGSRWSRCPRGAGFEFVDKIFGGSIPQNYRPAVEKGDPRGLRARVARGQPGRRLPGDADRRLVPRRRLVGDGVQDRGLARVQGGDASRRARRSSSRSMAVEITAPEEYDGRHHGRPLLPPRQAAGDGSQGHYQVIKASVPLAEMLTYALDAQVDDLAIAAPTTWSSTTTRRSPAQIQEKIVAEARARTKARGEK